MKDARSLVCSFVRSGSRSFAPTVHSCFAAARRRRQGRRSRKPRHNVRLRKAAPWMVASTAAGLHGSGRRRSDDRATPSWSPAMLSTPSQLCAHGCIVPSSRSGLLYNMGEWERERPSHAVTAAPSNCVNGLTNRMANIVKPISTSDDLSTAEEWYLTVRCTNTACTRLIAFQKAIYRGNHLNLRLAITGETSVDCPYCGTRVRFGVGQIECRKVMLS